MFESVRLRSLVRPLLVASMAMASTACTSTVGPVVRDVRYAPDGSIVVERCDLELTYAAFKYVPDASFENCRNGAPGPALAAVTRGPVRAP